MQLAINGPIRAMAVAVVDVVVVGVVVMGVLFA